MAKPTPVSIVDVWNKTAPALESGDFSAIEQLTLIHVLIALNRNLWQPVKVNPAIIAAATFKDKRTISNAIEKLITADMLERSEKGALRIGGYYYNQGGNPDGAAANSGVQSPDTVRPNSGGDGDSAETKPARRKRTIFNNSSV